MLLTGELQDEHGSTTERSAPETLECLVGLLERERLHLRPHRDLGREREKLLAVRTGQVRDGANVRSPQRSS